MADDGEDRAPGWYPHPTRFWTERRWDGSSWTEKVERSPDLLAEGSFGAIALFPAGAIFGNLSAKNLEKYGYTGLLAGHVAVDGAHYMDIDSIDFRKPGLAEFPGRLAVRHAGNRSSWAKRSATCVQFKARSLPLMQAARRELEERVARARQDQRAIRRRARPPITDAPGWFPDPAGRNELRYRGPSGWTRYVHSGGRPSIDQL